jgi:hypothetical protein
VNATLTVVDGRVQAVVTVTSCPAGIAWVLDWPVLSGGVSVPAPAEETRSETSWRNGGENLKVALLAICVATKTWRVGSAPHGPSQRH